MFSCRNMQTGHRLGGIDFFRFFFIVHICFCHIWTQFSHYHADFAVEFFFILSGMMLYKTSRKNVGTDILVHIRRRVLRLYPAYFVAVLVGFVFGIVYSLKSGEPISLWGVFMQLIPELLMVQQVGFFPCSINFNPAVWYVSALIIADSILYVILYFSKSEKRLACIVPILAFGCYSSIFCRGLHLTDVFGYMQAGSTFLPLTVCRSLGGMSVGVMIAALMQKTELSPWKVRILDACSIVGVACVTLYMNSVRDYYEPVMLILLSFVCAALMIPQSFFNRFFSVRMCYFLGGIVYEFFLFHILCKPFINKVYVWLGAHQNIRFLFVAAFILLTIAISYAFKCLVNKMLSRSHVRQR